MKIILVRHGESEKNVNITNNKDSPLTARGKKQVEHLANRLKEYDISEIYSSNLVRAKQTAEIISKKIKIPIKEHFQELNEYEIKELKSRSFHLFNIRLKKLKKLLKIILKDKNKDKNIIIVAHGTANKIILGHLLNLKPSKRLVKLSQDNACINLISWNEQYRNWSAWSINDVEHLPITLRNQDKINSLNLKK